MTRVLHDDLRALRMCNPGARAWFVRRGLSWHQLVLGGGLSEAELLAAAPDDAQVRQVLAQARRREAGA